MILSSMVDLRVRGGIVPAHTGRLDKQGGKLGMILCDGIKLRTAHSSSGTSRRFSRVDTAAERRLPSHQRLPRCVWREP